MEEKWICKKCNEENVNGVSYCVNCADGLEKIESAQFNDEKGEGQIIIRDGTMFWIPKEMSKGAEIVFSTYAKKHNINRSIGRDGMMWDN